MVEDSIRVAAIRLGLVDVKVLKVVGPEAYEPRGEPREVTALSGKRLGSTGYYRAEAQIMLDQLDAVLADALPLLLDLPEKWDSLLVNRRKPFTYRVFTHLPDRTRICLHKFDPCHTHEAFEHPHPWPGAFVILQGRYRMKIGYSPDRTSPYNTVATFYLDRHSSYEITTPLTWHAVVPQVTTYTVMINGEPWPADVAHMKTVTTKGKDLDRMPPDELLGHLQIFKQLVSEYNAGRTQRAEPKAEDPSLRRTAS